MTDHYCVIGKDVSRSGSPAMMHAAFRSQRIDASYGKVSASEKGFPREFRRLESAGFRGMNITIPFKSAVIPFLAGLDSVATRTQAVNTVKMEDGKYLGHNTDPDGIVGPLQGLPAALDIRNALLIGAGGAARAFCEAMNRIGCVDVAVAVREVERARRFVTDMEMAFPRLNLTLASLKDLRFLGHDLIFNATPLGAAGEALPGELKRILPGTKVVFDAVYRPRETKLLEEAKKAGSRGIYGEEMLLHQGMAAFFLWTGKEAPEKVMRKALDASRALEPKRKRRGSKR